MPGKINENLKELLGQAPQIGLGVAQGMSPLRATLSAAGSILTEKILGPAAGVAGIFLGVSRTLAAIIRQTDMWGHGMAQMRSIEGWESKFETILRSATLAKERMKDLASMSIRTPFNMQELAGASRNLELLTKGAYSSRNALSAVGDAAAATGANIEDVAYTIGKLYNFLESGRSVQNLAFHLQSMGVISGELQNRLELMQASGSGFSQMWSEVTNELNRTRGAMAAEMNTLGGLTARLEAARNAMARGYGENFVDQEKNGIYASIKMTESLSPVMKLIGRDVAAVTGVWRGWTSGLKGSIADTLGVSKALEVLWRGFTLVGAGIATTVSVSVGKFAGGIGKQRAQLKGMIAAGAESSGARAWLSSRALQKAAAAQSFSAAGAAFETGAFAQAGVSAAMGLVHRGRAYVSRLGAAGAAAAAGTRTTMTAAATAAGEKIEEALLRRTATAAAAKAVALTAVGDAAKVAVKGGKQLVAMLASMVTSIPVYGWVAGAIGAAALATVVWIRHTRDAKNRLDDMTKSLNASREAFLRQAQAITTVEQRSAALNKAYEMLSDAQRRRANAKNDKEAAVADKAIATAKSDIDKTAKRLVGRSMSEDDMQAATDRRHYEKYELPVAELESQMEGASPARRAAIAKQIAGIRRAQRDEAEQRISEQTRYSNSEKGTEYNKLLGERDRIAGEKDATEAISELEPVVKANRFTKDIRGREYERTVIGGHLRGSPEGRAAEARSIAARDEIARLRAFEKPENATQFEDYKKTRIEALNKRIDALAPDSETTGKVRALLKDVEENPNLSDSERIAKRQEAEDLQVELRARNQNAQRFKGAGGAELVASAERAERIADIELRAYRERMNLEIALLNIKESGWDATKQEMDARIDSAKRELDLVRELAKVRGSMDEGAEQEATNRLASLKRDKAIAEAQHKEARRQAEAPLKEMQARNAIGMAMLSGNAVEAARLQDEEQRRQITERLYNARQHGIASGMSGNEAVNIERRKIEAEQASELMAQYQQEQEQAVAGVEDPTKRQRLQRGMAFRSRMEQLVAGGMDSGSARSQAEREFGGSSSDLSAAEHEADFFLAGQGDMSGRLSSDMAIFGNSIASPGLTAEELAKQGMAGIPGMPNTPTEITAKQGGRVELTSVLATLSPAVSDLSKKIQDAKAVLVIGGGKR